MVTFSEATMHISNWNRAPAKADEARTSAIPTKRSCGRCHRVAELIDVTANGTALYLCPERHENLVDVSNLQR